MSDSLDRIMHADTKRDPHQDAEVGRLRALHGGADEPTALEAGNRYAEKRKRAEKRQRRSEVPLPEDLAVHPDPIEEILIVAEVEHLLSRLPERHRAALTLKYLQLLSTNEVGSSLGISPQSARNLLADSLTKLRSHRTD